MSQKVDSKGYGGCASYIIAVAMLGMPSGSVPSLTLAPSLKRKLHVLVKSRANESHAKEKLKFSKRKLNPVSIHL